MAGGGEQIPGDQLAKKTFFITLIGCVSFAMVVFVAIL